MGAASDYLENKLLDHTLRTSSFTTPTSIWVGLCSAVATDSTTNECTKGTYKRKQITFQTAASGSIISDASTITYDQATGTAWDAINGYALFDSSSAGNMLYYASLAASVSVAIGDKVEFGANAVTVTLD